MPTTHLLVVTTTRVGDDALRELVRKHLRGAEARVRVVAPASKVSPLDWLSSAEDDARAEAEERAVETSKAVGEVAAAESRVGDTDPVMAIRDALATFPADEILLVTEPGSEATWLEKDTTGEAVDRFGVPVTHVVAGRG